MWQFVFAKGGKDTAGILAIGIANKEIKPNNKIFEFIDKYLDLDIVNTLADGVTKYPELYNSLSEIFKTLLILNNEDREYLIFHWELFNHKGGDKLTAKIDPKKALNNQNQQLVGEIRKILNDVRTDLAQFKAKILSGTTSFSDYEYLVLDTYLREIYLEHKNDEYIKNFQELAEYFEIPDWASKPRHQVLKEIDKQLKTVSLKPVTYSFDMKLKGVSLTLPDEYAQNFRNLLVALPELSEEEKGAYLDKLKSRENIADLIPQLLDINTRDVATQQFLETLENPTQMQTMQSKLKGMLNANLSPEQKRENLQKMLSFSVSLSIGEQSAIFNSLIDSSNLRETITSFIDGELTSEDEGSTLVRLIEMETTYLPDFLSVNPELNRVKDQLESTELWKAIKQIKKQVLEIQQKQQKDSQNIQLVLGNRTILDVFQGISSGTCFGDSPAHLSKRENIVPIKMVKDGELFGNALVIIQPKRMILIGFDPSVSFTSATDANSERLFVDKSLSGLKWIAEQNNWEFMIGMNNDETGGLSNRRDGVILKVLEEYIKGQPKVVIIPEAKLQPQHGYYPKHAHQLSDEINKRLDSNMVKQNVPLRVIESTAMVNSAKNISPLDGCSVCSTEFLPGVKEILAKMETSEESQKEVLKEAREYVKEHINDKQGNEVKNTALMQTVDFLLAKEQAYVDDKLSLFEKIYLLNEIGQAQRAVNNKNG